MFCSADYGTGYAYRHHLGSCSDLWRAAAQTFHSLITISPNRCKAFIWSVIFSSSSATVLCLQTQVDLKCYSGTGGTAGKTILVAASVWLCRRCYLYIPFFRELQLGMNDEKYETVLMIVLSGYRTIPPFSALHDKKAKIKMNRMSRWQTVQVTYQYIVKSRGEHHINPDPKDYRIRNRADCWLQPRGRAVVRADCSNLSKVDKLPN